MYNECTEAVPNINAYLKERKPIDEKSLRVATKSATSGTSFIKTNLFPDSSAKIDFTTIDAPN
jgi:hypothetical protein